MKKTLLLGNGFTSHLIPEYSNIHMMNRLQNEAPQLLQIANEKFEPFRIEGNIRNTQRGFGRCGSNRPKFDKPITGLPYNDKTITHINIELINHGFHKRYDVNMLCKDYFQTNGLIYEIQKENISCVESLLKIVQLFQMINTFSESDSKELKKFQIKFIGITIKMMRLYYLVMYNTIFKPGSITMIPFSLQTSIVLQMISL